MTVPAPTGTLLREAPAALASLGYTAPGRRQARTTTARYDVISAESLAAGGGRGRYDVVVASEVLEHVAKPHALLGVLASLLAPQEETPGAAVVVSTLNRWGMG